MAICHVIKTLNWNFDRINHSLEKEALNGEVGILFFFLIFAHARGPRTRGLEQMLKTESETGERS